VEGLEWSNKSESYAGGNVDNGSASHSRQVKGDDPDKKGQPGPPCWGLSVGLTSPRKKEMSRNLTKLRRLRFSLGCNAIAGDAYHALKPLDKVNTRKFRHGTPKM